MIALIKVTGNSLSPEYQEGDFVLVVKIPFFLRRLKVGDVVVFKHPYYGTMVKKVESLAPDGGQFFVVGTHPDSTDSRQFGTIHKEDLVGKVLWHFKKS